MSIILWVLAAFSGLVVFANYADCDPLKAGVLTKKDQIIPYYVMDKLGHIHGLPGIFLACLFSGALRSVSPPIQKNQPMLFSLYPAFDPLSSSSTLSSGLNSLAAVTYVDGIMLTPLRKKLTDFQASILTKCLGMLPIGMSFEKGWNREKRVQLNMVSSPQPWDTGSSRWACHSCCPS